MTLPKVKQGLPVGKWGEPDGQDGLWLSIDVAIEVLQQAAMRRRGLELSHEQAEALLLSAVNDGHVLARPQEAGGGLIRHTEYFGPDIENLFEEVAAEPASPPVVEQPAEIASAPPVIEQLAEEAPRARGPKDGKSLEHCYEDARPILEELRASGKLKKGNRGYLAAARELVKLSKYQGYTLGAIAERISAEEHGVSKKPKGTIEGRPVPEVPPPKTRH